MSTRQDVISSFYKNLAREILRERLGINDSPSNIACLAEHFKQFEYEVADAFIQTRMINGDRHEIS